MVYVCISCSLLFVVILIVRALPGTQDCETVARMPFSSAGFCLRFCSKDLHIDALDTMVLHLLEFSAFAFDLFKTSLLPQFDVRFFLVTY
jgi:hypothetical protein